MVWAFNKIMRKAVFGINVHEPSVLRTKKVFLESDTRVVLMPIYKSFADFFLQVYCNFHYDLGMPFTFGNMEDTPHIKIFDKWLKQTGYIFSKRSQNQNLQSNYVNSAILKEIIENNKITTVFQNNLRLRSGKLHHRVLPDMSVKWLLDTYITLSLANKNLTIVPVMVSYDRIFEIQNLSSEMVSGATRNLSFFEAINKIYNFKENQLGSVYVKYLEPLNVRNYLQERGVGNLQPDQIEQEALELTQELLRRQQKELPVTLNSIVASCLLQETDQTLKMSKLIAKLKIIYEYIKVKDKIVTYMEVEPQQVLVEMHVTGLGFQMKNKGKKNCEILLNSKNADLRTMLGLSHYSLQLSAVFILEGCMCHVIQAHFAQKDAKPLYITELFERGKKLAEFLKNEHLISYSQDEPRMRERMLYFIKREKINWAAGLENEAIVIDLNANESNMFLEFFSFVTQSLVDSYLVVLLSIERICGINVVLKQKKLVNELHLAIKNLYADSMLPHLHSCLKEILWTALDRYESMGLFEQRSYGNKKGSTTSFIQSSAENKQKLQEAINFISSCRALSTNQIKSIDEEISSAIQRAQGPIPLGKL